MLIELFILYADEVEQLEEEQQERLAEIDEEEPPEIEEEEEEEDESEAMDRMKSALSEQYQECVELISQIQVMTRLGCYKCTCILKL